MNILFQIIPLLYILAVLGAAIYAFGLLVRFVRASERAAAALEEIARKNR
jgi:hypothetical protein